MAVSASGASSAPLASFVKYVPAQKRKQKKKQVANERVLPVKPGRTVESVTWIW